MKHGVFGLAPTAKRFSLVAAVLAPAVMMFAQPASASTLTFYLNQFECSGSPCTAPAPISNASAVQVVVNLITSTSATVTFTPPVGTPTITTPVYINVNDGGVVANVTATSNVGGSMFRSDPGQAEDHFGNMNVGTAGGFSLASITITLTANGGFSWSDVSNVLMPTVGFASTYGHGFEAVDNAQFAGYASPTPLPAALPLFGSGLGLMGLLGWRKKRKVAA